MNATAARVEMVQFASNLLLRCLLIGVQSRTIRIGALASQALQMDGVTLSATAMSIFRNTQPVATLRMMEIVMLM